jgi:hypothetical protein
MLSGNQSRLYLNSCSFSCSPHILPLISLIDPCKLYLQGDILFALLGVISASKCVEILLATIPVPGYVVLGHEKYAGQKTPSMT